MSKLTAYLGVASVGLFAVAFLAFSMLRPDFDVAADYISKLGGRGQPFALWWNLIGFVLVGIMFSAFGWAYGRVVKDHLVGICLIFAGIGFAMGAIPADFVNPNAPLSKAHFVSICLALAGWCLGLARLGSIGGGDVLVRKSANFAGIFAVVPMIGTAIGYFSAPVSHRLVLVVVFGWVLFASVRFLTKRGAE